MPNSVVAARRRAFRAQGGLCCYCGQPMWETHKRAFALKYQISRAVAKNYLCTAEHKVARREGGAAGDNIAAACRFCNENRHAGRALTAPPFELYRQHVMLAMSERAWGHTPLQTPKSADGADISA